MPIHDWTRVEAGVFHHFHTTWIPDILRTLINGLLPPGYYAMVEQVAANVVPDVVTLQHHSNGSNGSGHRYPSPPSGGGVVALAAAPPRVDYRQAIEPKIYATKARSLVIRPSSNDRIVAVIEIVSPGNKQSRDSLRVFVEKAADLLRAGVHLLIIDLFPPTKRDPQGIHAAIMEEIADDGWIQPPERPLTLASYIGGDFQEAFVQPVAVGNPLPVMPLFLDPGSYINLPLEPSYMSAYATVPPHWREVLEK